MSGTATTDATTWNVLTTDWLDVMDLEARCHRVSVLDAVRRAASLGRIVSPNPLDVFAAHRFILTLLYWKSADCGGVADLRKALLAGRIPRALVPALKAEESLFGLFDAKRPFLQDPAVKNAKDLPASSLFAEMASGTNVAHFNHGDDDASRLCLRCATLGMLRLVPWTQSGGAGKQPSVHGAPPIVTLAVGQTLAETLGLNLIPVDTALGKPQWSGQFKPAGKKSGVELLEGLTWNPRRVHLRSPLPAVPCFQCGESAVATVGQIAFEKNPACKAEDGSVSSWRDPAAFYKGDDHRTTKTGREADAAAGDDLRRLFEQRFGKKLEPAPVAAVVAANPSHTGWWAVMPCTNPANNKSYDHRAVMLEGFVGEPPKRAKSWTDEVVWEAKDDRRVTPFNGRAPTRGAKRFVAAAARLDSSSWAVVANAAGRGMDDDPAAFDIFSGVYWPLRGKQDALPSKGAAWITLKLMATAGPARPARGAWDGAFRPWEQLSSAASPAKQNRYVRAVPQGALLERELRELIRKATASTPNTKVAWPALCQFLHDVTP